MESTENSPSVSSSSSSSRDHWLGSVLSMALVGVCTGVMACEHPSTAHAAADSDGRDNADGGHNDKGIGMFSEGLDFQTLSLAAGVGVVPGFCAGFALRKVGNVATFMVGGVFFMFQMAAYKGYVTIHWDEVERDLNGILDFSRNDSSENGKGYPAPMSEERVNEIVGMLTHNTKGALGGFAGGFFMGWRSG